MPGFEVIGTEEQAEVNEVFSSGGVLFRHSFDALRNGCYKVRDFESAFAEAMGASHALAVSSGTAALRVALASLGIGRGDEVVTQSFTFVATVEAIIEAGATPVCTEVDDTLNMDVVDLRSRITPRTKAVIVVHMLGTPARLHEIRAITAELGVPLIEDTAWGCGGTLSGQHLGTIGEIGTYSFDFAKTMTTGEGGMVVFRDAGTAERARAWHDHGHENNPTLPRWEDSRSSSGFNYRMSELQGAVGLAQLRKLSDVVEAQRRSASRIRESLRGCPGIEWRAVPDMARETADAVVFFVKSSLIAGEIRENLLDVGLGTKILPEAVSWHFAGTWDHMPQLVSHVGGDVHGAWPRSEALLARAVALPVMVHMDDTVPARISSAVRRAVGA
jgi:8-amino-3,8-dideoxy-alpha-D-manno-octulosonate transaminase